MSLVQMIRVLPWLFVICFVFMTHGVRADAQGMSLSSEAWELLRHGENMLKSQELNEIVNEWKSHADSKIELRYPGGEEGELWVEELKDWLVSLAIPSHKMTLMPGSDAKDVINISVIKIERKHE